MAKGLEEINASQRGYVRDCRVEVSEMYGDPEHRGLNRAKPCLMKHFPDVAGHDHVPGLLG